MLGGVVLLVVAVVIVAVAAVETGAHEVPLSNAYRQFRHRERSLTAHRSFGRPAEGVYTYHGSGTDSLSLPPKTIHDGPVIPGTVTYGPKGCWTLRMEFSNSHTQFATWCRRATELLEIARGGSYAWNFIATIVSDTATYACDPGEIVVPRRPERGHRYHFSCLGHNHPLQLAPVTMSGWVEELGKATLFVKGQPVSAVHLFELARFSGGQSGREVEDTWYDTSTGLPLLGTWSTDVQTPTPIGVSTLDATTRFVLQALAPHT
ncbi:MAG: hypothetical protein ACYCSF_06615 [Acidimicrobiales bacterium]